MFDSLSDRLTATLGDLRGRGRLTEDDIARAMREIRLALLEADVNFRVVKDFVATVRERATGADVLESLTPGQQVVKIVLEELTALMGEGAAKLEFAPQPPTVILMCGLQGSGKTTTTGKLARLLAKQGKKPALVACDIYRPAAIDQLQTVGEQAGVPVYEQGTDADPVDIAEWGVRQARQQGRDVVILDTAGRLHVDDELMDELVRVRDAVKPDQHAAGARRDDGPGRRQRRQGVQRAAGPRRRHHDEARRRRPRRRGALRARGHRRADQVRVRRREARRARGVPPRPHGRAHPRAWATWSRSSSAPRRRSTRRRPRSSSRSCASAEFTLDDLLDQLKQIRKMGSLGSLLKMIPGVGKQLRGMNVDDRQLDRVEAIILSMTPEERRRPELINGSRRARIAKGSGTSVQQINQLLLQHKQMKKMMKQMAGGKMPRVPTLPPGARKGR